MSFSINCLEITATKEQWKKSKSLYKNLLSEKDYRKKEPNEKINKRFFFNDYYNYKKKGELERIASKEKLNSEFYFGKNINVQVVAGKNGSGKSSLMELMYLAINNFACFFTHLMPRSNYFARGVYVKLYFNINLLEYVMECDGTIIKLYNKWHIFRVIQNEEMDVEHFTPLSDNQAKFIAEKFFFTIVSNYALLSFVPYNYKANCIELIRPSSANQKWRIEDVQESWIQRIFHKNDGYTCPIVLNPMRNEGTIDVEKEMELSKDRLLALLIHAKKGNYSFDDKYELRRIDVLFRHKFAFDNLKQWEKFKKLDPNAIIKIIDSWLTNPDSISQLIIRMFNLNVSVKSMNIKKIALAYLQGKILSLTKYNSYANFRKGGSEDLKIKDIDDVDKENLKNMIKEIFLDSSHAVTKIHRAVNFLSLEDDDDLLFVKRNALGAFDYESVYESSIRKSIGANRKKWSRLTSKKTDYFHPPFIHIKPWEGEKISTKREFSLDEIIECLPPSIFECKIYLFDKIGKKEVLYDRMSSGELQLFQTISTHIYHIRNIMSVNGNRVRYKNINMVFDELEICFHPEYQRLFVKKLIDVITNMKLNEQFSFNIFLITHSPFVLSDIPAKRILYMEDGKGNPKITYNTFGQNIGSLLYNSFFLEYYVGGLAKKKINEILDEFDNDKRMSKNIFEKKISIFGDDMLKRQMMNYYKKNKV